MDDRFYDFDSDKAYEGSGAKNKNNAPRPSRKEFEINIPYRNGAASAKNGESSARPDSAANGKSALKSTMQKNAPQKKKLSKGKKFLVILGIIITCPTVAALSAFGVVWGWSNFSLPGSEQKNELMDSTSKEDVYLDISDDGTSVEVVPMYKDAPSSSSGSSSSKKHESGTSSSSNKSNQENDDSSKDNKDNKNSKDESSSENKTDKNDKNNNNDKNEDSSNSDSSSSGTNNSGSGTGSGSTGSGSTGSGSGSTNAGTDEGAQGSSGGKNNDEIITIE